ncbi:MAG: O-antigen ligase family protein, partial [Candidatus Marinimicrobia bacterium]|nr:O-antigen ligase family protein [Candidatus Neomarinimicrobiota bacterium]
MRALFLHPAPEVSSLIRGGLFFFRLAFTIVWTGWLFKDLHHLKYFVLGVGGALGGMILNMILYTFRQEGRLTVATFGVNTFGHLMAIFGIIFFAYFLGMNRKNSPLIAKMGLGAAAGLCAIFALMAGTRMSLAMMGIGFFWLLAFRPLASITRKMMTLLSIAAVGAVFIFFIFRANPGIAKRVTDPLILLENPSQMQQIAELYSRFQIWNSSMEMIISSPILGIGPGQWNFVRHMYGFRMHGNPWLDWVVLDSHNGYLHFGAEYGVPAMLLYYLILLFAIWSGHKAIRILLSKRPFEPPDVILFVSILRGLSLAIVLWMMSDITNASNINVRVQGMLYLIIGVLVWSPLLVQNKLAQNRSTE